MNRLIYCSLWMSFSLFLLLNIYGTGECETNYDDVMKTLKHLDSPVKVRKYLKDFKYEFDQGILKEPMIKSPFLFVKDRKGDCKDFANFGYKCGVLHDADVSYMSVYSTDTTKRGHAFCVWRVNNKYYPICNYTCMYPLVKFEFTSLKDIIKQYKQAFNWKETREPSEGFPLPYGILYFPRLYY